MRDLLICTLILILLGLGCKAEKNEVLLDSEIPPEDQLIKVSARDLAEAYTRGKQRNTFFDNAADKVYRGNWLKVTGEVDRFRDRKDGFGYSLEFDTFGGDPDVECIGNFPPGYSAAPPAEGSKVVVVGKMVSSGNTTTLYLNPCKILMEAGAGLR